MIIQTENTSTCQAACHFCVYPDLKRYGGKMDMDLFRKIVDEAPEMNCRKFVIHGLGEPLLDANLEERISYVHDTLYGVPVEIYTNGQFLTPERFDSLKAAGLTGVIISLNAIDSFQHKEIMDLKCFQAVCSNVDYALKNAEHVIVKVHAVADGKHFTDSDAKVFRNRWGKDAKVFFMGNWMGDKDTKHDFDPNSYCARSDQTMYITYDGKVTPCCFSPTGKVNFGDCNENTLSEIHGSREYREFRRAHIENRASEYDFCASCTRI